MRKLISMFVAATLLMSFTACNNETPSVNADGDGTLKLNFSFDVPKQGRAATSEAIPNTAWTNITELQLVLVQSGVAKIVRTVTVPGSGAATTTAQVFDRIPAGAYDIYLIGNNRKVGNPFSATAATIGTSAAIQAGTNFATEMFKLATSTESIGTATANSYGEASELFIGYATGSVTADVTTPTINVTLKRAVSLLRIRIDQTDTASEADKILFVGAGAANTSIRLRRHAKELTLTKTLPFVTPNFDTNKTTAAFVSKKPFSNVATPAGYTGSMGIGTDFTLWNDYLILPGGHATLGTDKFNLLLSGHAPNGYVGINGVTSTGAGDAARVWWQADVDGAIGANGILSLNVKISTKGVVDPQPPVVDLYGKLSITASITTWDAVTNVTVPM